MSGYIEGLFLPKINIPKGLTLTPAYLRIYEGIFPPACTLTTEYPPSGRPQPRRRCTYTDEREMPVRTTGENLLDDGLQHTKQWKYTTMFLIKTKRKEGKYRGKTAPY